jgi:hypothetical protein
MDGGRGACMGTDGGRRGAARGLRVPAAAAVTLAAGMIALGGCASSSGTRTVELEVAETRVACIGVAAQECLLVRPAGAREWQYMYEEIAGFTWDSGYRYRLRIEERTISSPPMDGSSIGYRLLSVEARTAAPNPALLARIDAAEQRWRQNAPGRYTIELQRNCFCAVESRGPVRFEVTRESYGATAIWERVTSPVVYTGSGAAVASDRLHLFPTVQRLFNVARVALANDAHRIEIDFDEALGHPRRVLVDRSAGSADDEVEYVVISLR